MKTMQMFENRIRRELTLKARQVEASDILFAKILDNTQTISIKKNGLFCNNLVSTKSLVIFAVCIFIVLSTSMLTFSKETRALAAGMINKVKTIFIIDKVDGQYKLAEKSVDESLLNPCSGKTSQLGDFELSKKIGFYVKFPKVLYGYKFMSKSEGVLLTGKIDYKTYEILQKDILNAIDNTETFKALEKYKPVRFTSGSYNNGPTTIYINAFGYEDNEILSKSTMYIKVRIGEKNGFWVEQAIPLYPLSGKGEARKEDISQKPFDIKTTNTLFWKSNGVSYYLYSSMTLTDAIKAAEIFIENQK